MQTQTPQINPYGAPQAAVVDHVGDEPILERGRQLPASRALGWYREAWRLFKVSPGVWIGIWVTLMLILMGLGLVPGLGGIAVGLLTPLFIGGVAIAARRADREGSVRFGDLFAAFRDRAGPLLLIGLLQMLITFAIGMLVVLLSLVFVGAGVAFGAGEAEASLEQLMGSTGLIALVVLVVVLSLIFVPITYAVWFASILAALHDLGAIEALRRSFGAAFRNLASLLLFALITLPLAIVALIPAGLGWLVLGPLILIAVYVQYREMFEVQETAQSTPTI